MKNSPSELQAKRIITAVLAAPIHHGYVRFGLDTFPNLGSQNRCICKGDELSCVRNCAKQTESAEGQSNMR